MSTWTDQPGFPFVSLKSFGSKSFKVEQSRFLFANLVHNNATMKPEIHEQVWHVPLTYSVYSNSTGRPSKITSGFMDFKTSDAIVEFETSVPSNSVIFFNNKQTGVYRSLYDPMQYYYLIDWLRHDLEFLPAVERAGLFSDIFSMTFSGRLQDPTIALDLVQLLTAETNVFVWESALKDLDTLKDIFALDPAYGSMIRFQSSLVSAVVQNIGWVETSRGPATHVRAKLRGRILREAVRLGHGPTTKTALNYYALLREGRDDKVKLDPDVYGAIYNAGIIHGNLDDYEWVISKYMNTTFAPHQQMYLQALASSPVAYLQQRTLLFAISGDVRLQDVTSLVSQVATYTPLGHVSTWLFFMENWEKLNSGDSGKTFGQFNKLLSTVCGQFTKQYLIAEAERLFVRQEDPNFKVDVLARVSVMKGLETAKQMLAWRKLYGDRVSQWLKTNAY